MKIIVLDGYTVNPGDKSWGEIEALGETTIYDRTSLTEAPIIAERIGGAEVVVTNKTPISRATLEKCPGVRTICVLATGYNVVDCEAARERGVTVQNVPAYSTGATSQFAIALLLELCSRVGEHSASVHAGDWARCADFSYCLSPLTEVAGKTAGIIGLGRIGRATARVLRAMDARVLATGSRPTDEGRALAEYVTLDELLSRSDFVFLHCPLLPETAGIIRRENIEKMKDGAFLINNGRGGLVVEQDLRDALDSGKLGGAAVDVAASEPIDPASPLLGAKNCIITPHISWATKEAEERLISITAENIRSFAAGRPANVVNGL